MTDTGLTICIGLGKLVGKYASERALRIEEPKLDFSQVNKEKNRISSFLRTEPSDGYLPAQVKKRIREIMWEKMHYIKNEKKMKEALALLKDVRDKMLPKMRLESKSLAFNYDLVEALDVVNMLDICELIILSSLFRKESRGCFQRKDYPKTDNKNWFKNIILKKENGKPKLFTSGIKIYNDGFSMKPFRKD
jgi:succinate dehydrogenase/fumarate reductase flavoprotein subunit